MTTRTFQESGTEGVSESIGFLLIFTLMITGIGLVTLYGYPLLVQQQQLQLARHPQPGWQPQQPAVLHCLALPPAQPAAAGVGLAAALAALAAAAATSPSAAQQAQA